MSETDWRQNINRISLTAARKNVGLTTAEATGRVLAKNPKNIDRVGLWESGEASPTYRQLEKLAEVYNINPLQLLLDDALEAIDPPAAFRSSKAKTSGYNLSRFISVLRLRQGVIGDNLRRDDIPEHALVGSGRQYRDPEDLADFIRQKINYDIKRKPAGLEILKHLRSLLHKRFIFVLKTMSTKRDLIDPGEMRGMYLHDSHAPFIILNRRDHKSSQLFSLAHELAHLFRAEERIDSIEFRSVEQINNPNEAFCNRVAAAFLIPRGRIASRQSWLLDDIKSLAENNHVSSLVALYRLNALGYINRQTTDRYSKQLSQAYEEHQARQITKATKDSGGNYYNNMRDSNGELFGAFVFSIHQAGRLSAVEAQNLLKMPLLEIQS